MRTREELMELLEARKPEVANGKSGSEWAASASAEMRLIARECAVESAIDALRSASTVEIALGAIQRDVLDLACYPEESTSPLDNVYDRLVLAEHARVLRDLLFWWTP